jgi:NAD(P)-dependent dehydrogenase (short-subunit alcohol dehydrogenase family)
MTQSPPTPAESTPPLALITGASRGLGHALAFALASKGWQVIAVARTAGALDDLDDRIRAAGGVAPVLAPLDITDPEAVKKLAEAISLRFGRLNLWVQAAIQAAPLSPAGHIAPKDWDKTLNTLARATGQMIPRLDPILTATLREGGAAMAVFLDDPSLRVQGETRANHAALGAAKAAQMALAQAWAAECAALGPARAPVVRIETPDPMPTGARARLHPGQDAGALSTPAQEAAKLIARLGL